MNPLGALFLVMGGWCFAAGPLWAEGERLSPTPDSDQRDPRVKQAMIRLTHADPAVLQGVLSELLSLSAQAAEADRPFVLWFASPSVGSGGRPLGARGDP